MQDGSLFDIAVTREREQTSFSDHSLSKIQIDKRLQEINKRLHEISTLEADAILRAVSARAGAGTPTA